MHSIASESLTLEPQMANHAEGMFDVLGDPALYVYENELPPSLAWLHARFARLESRTSPDGMEQWLNWVIRLNSSDLVGYVQATVNVTNHAAIAYVLHSKYWGQGLAYEAVRAMIGALAVQYQVRTFTAVLKRENFRSVKLLRRLGFSVPAKMVPGIQLDIDEMMMHLQLGSD